MRGDFVRVVYRTGSGVGEEIIKATSVGSSVKVEEPREKDLFVEVDELNKAGAAVRKARFAKGDVIALIEGHEVAQKTKRARA